MKVRDTPTLRTLLRVFLDEPRRSRYGAEILPFLKTTESNLYRILWRLEDMQILVSYEEIPMIGQSRAPRRMYLMTNYGIREARALLHARDVEV